MSRTRKLRVALAVPQGLTFLERVLQGVADYARQAGGWTFTRVPEALGTSARWLRHWQGDGAFALVVTRADANVVKRLPFPVVNLASHLSEAGVPSVVVDHAAIGALAARHLLERQFRRFGYYGPARLWYSQLRRDSFAKSVRAAGGEFAALETREGASGARRWRDQQRELGAWLSSLRPPVGVMASTDLRAVMVLEACREVGLRVPEDVAAVGVDNDPVGGEFCDPPLTTVSRNDREVGRAAARLLDRLIAGAPAPAGPVFVPPDGIIARRSTETLAIEDPYVADAVRYMRRHVHRRFGIAELLREVPVSRRSLEYRFRACLGRSPHEYLARLRVEAAKRLLLAGPDRPKLAAVAAACGFPSPRRFRLVFHQHVGTTPSAFRRDGAPV